MKTAEIREAYLKFFEQKGHTRAASSSLVPMGDPTLLFVNAGMVQFKDTFLGLEQRPYSRATTCQKCLRISGKHNDLENVGRTARHHTFFEMLGNFSFGDYFKEDAIKFAWEFVTQVLELPKDKLWVTVYNEDEEARSLWRANTDVLAGRILGRGQKDNFWAMGDTGPCGPCSEIFCYVGPEGREQQAQELLDDDPRYIEIWNLVFMQFNRDAQGALSPLPKPSVDTGMGLERVAAIKQGVRSNYDTDGFRRIISFTESLSGKHYDGSDYTERDPESDPQYGTDVALRVVADHVRAAAFLVADGISPSSDGRGYVLRRLIRRACRHGRVLGLREAFLYKVAGELVALMSTAYPELMENAEKIKRVIKKEEEKFLLTLDLGLSILTREIEALKEKGAHMLRGEVAFLLHDTYGFPLDMTEDILRVHHLTLDHEGFTREMERQRERSRGAAASASSRLLRNIKPLPTVFKGYDHLEYESAAAALYGPEGEVPTANEGEEIALIAPETPFYAESGGQVGDTGRISSNSAALEVLDTQKSAEDTIVHLCRVVEGTISRGEKIRLEVDAVRRQKLRLHHSATHLLHLALKDVLGEHAKQSGSRVSDQSFRFDFTHGEPVSAEQLAEIERLVNLMIQENHEISTTVLNVDEAKRSGAVALFGEKYGESVRVVQMGPRSRELCGGTHAARTGDLGILTITSEGGIAAGIRRIEAQAGRSALDFIEQQRGIITELSSLLNTGATQLSGRVSRLLERTKDLERNVEKLSQKVNLIKGEHPAGEEVTLQDGTKVVTRLLEEASPRQLREAADTLRAQIGSGCVALGTVNKGKALLLTAVTPNLAQKYHAGELLREIAALIGSRGGGNAELAQAGGGDPAQLEQALRRFQELLQQ